MTKTLAKERTATEERPAPAVVVRSTLYREDVQLIRTLGGWRIVTTPWERT
jgi:hypothetical protein